MTASGIAPDRLQPREERGAGIASRLTQLFRQVERDLPLIVVLALAALAYAATRGEVLTASERILRLGSWAPALLGVAAAIAFLTMAVVDTFKRPIRRSFQQNELENWLRNDASSPGASPPARSTGDSSGNHRSNVDLLLQLIAPRYQAEV